MRWPTLLRRLTHTGGMPLFASSKVWVLSTVPGFAYAPAGPPVRHQPAPFEPGLYENRYPNWGGMYTVDWGNGPFCLKNIGSAK